MPFIHNTDFESFQRLLGCAGPDDVPENYIRIYSTAITAFHKDGGSGPLGSQGVIFCMLLGGWNPQWHADQVADVDWDLIKRGQRVEARFNGGWLTGEFLGFGQHRILLVQLDEIEEVKECSRHMVRLSDKPKPAPVEVKDEPLPAEVGEVLQHPPLSETDWTQAEIGEEVWATIDGQTEECKFTKLLASGEIVVTFNGDPYTLPAERVIRAALSAA